MRTLLCCLLVTCGAMAFGQSTGDVYKSSEARLQAAKALSGEMQVTFPDSQPQHWQFEFLKPNLYTIDTPDQEFHSNGATETVYLVNSKQFQTTDRKGPQIVDAPFSLGLDPFFAGYSPPSATSSVQTQLAGKPAVAVNVQEPGFSAPTAIYFDPQTNLPLGYDEPLGQGKTLSVRYLKLKLDPGAKASDFQWTPPKDAKPLDTTSIQSTLLKNDSQAPLPPARDIKDAPVDLGSYFRAHKATLLYFWSGDPPLPDAAALTQLMAQLDNQHLGIIVVDFDAHPSSRDTFGAEKLPFAVVLDADGSIAKAYGARIQVEYVIGNDGKVAGSFMGFDLEGIVKVLRQRGFRV